MKPNNTTYKNEDAEDVMSRHDAPVIIPQADEDRYIAWARMARRRQETSRPDTEAAWQSFRQQLHSEETPKNKSNVLHLVLAACAGAAAMLAVVLATGLWPASKSTSVVEKQAVVAFSHQAEPQHIVWTSEDEMHQTPVADSLSFRPVKVVAAETQTNNAPAHTTPSQVKMQKLATPRGMDFKVILPDGSEVWLNAESVIEFPSAFTATERRVQLKGEAFFKVARNEDCPFIVTSDQLQVKVLGTEFNFKTYATEAPHVSLVKGSVEVFRPGDESPSAILQPGQDATPDPHGGLRVQSVDTYAVTQWVNGFFYFDNQPLVDILCELGRWYNLGVVFRNTASMEDKIHFSVSRSESIDEALKNLNSLRKFKVSMQGNNLMVD